MAKTANVLLGLAAGTAIGVGLGILFAPDKGKNTREKIKDLCSWARACKALRVSSTKIACGREANFLLSTTTYLAPFSMARGANSLPSKVDRDRKSVV